MAGTAVATRGAVAGDLNRLFAETVMPYLDDALNLARWLTGNATDAEDVAQEAALRAFRALDRGRPESPRAWLLAITRNTAFTWLARNRPKALVLSADPEPAGEIEADPATAPDAAMIAQADAALVEAALAGLALPYREVLVMREINGLSYRDIAEATGVPIGTIMSRLARARKLMCAALKGQMDG